ncbi:MAG: hypothetical protein M3319_13700 [Actinomycetota bacterium]|nr:hypothetical protein [Actinomycetota bacterium]
MAGPAISIATLAARGVSSVVVLVRLKDDVKDVESDTTIGSTTLATDAAVTATLAASLGNADHGQHGTRGEQFGALAFDFDRVQ